MLATWKKIYDRRRQCFKKQRRYFANKRPSSQRLGFSSSYVYECESWTTKKAECWRTDAFELWCWRRLLRPPWTSRRSNQAILKEIIPEYSLEGLMLKLKLQFFGHLMQTLTHWKRPWCWGRLRARKLSSGHRTRKDQLSFQSQRRAMPKNGQTTIQLFSFHMLTRYCSKSFKLGFNNTRTENFQMYKLHLEKAEEPEIKLSTFIRS